MGLEDSVKFRANADAKPNAFGSDTQDFSLALCHRRSGPGALFQPNYVCSRIYGAHRTSSGKDLA